MAAWSVGFGALMRPHIILEAPGEVTAELVVADHRGIAAQTHIGISR